MKEYKDENINLDGFSYLCEGQTSNPEFVNIFIPGFGVNLFGSTKTGDIHETVKIAYKNILPNNHVSVFFEVQDYSPLDDTVSFPLTFEEQATRLKKLLCILSQKYPNSRINITAQSIGCLAIVPLIDFLKKNNFRLHNFALWGPPTFERDQHPERLSGVFIGGSTFIDPNGNSVLCCRDNKKLIVKREFWQSLSKNRLASELASVSGLFSVVLLFCASKDKLYPDGVIYYKPFLTKNCRAFLIQGESHTFREPTMQLELGKLMKQYFL